jgi:hypothetical protein
MLNANLVLNLPSALSPSEDQLNGMENSPNDLAYSVTRTGGELTAMFMRTHNGSPAESIVSTTFEGCTSY